MSHTRGCGVGLLVFLLVAAVVPAVKAAPAEAIPTAKAATAAASPLMSILQEELQRSMQGIKQKGEVPAWFLSYTVTETRERTVEGELGAIRQNSADHKRMLDIEVRVGPKGVGRSSMRGTNQVELPLTDDVAAIRRIIWQATDRQYRAAVREFHMTEARTTVDNDERKTANFSIEIPEHATEAPQTAMPNVADVEQRVRACSAIFCGYPLIYQSRVAWRGQNVNRWYVTSEGTSLQYSTSRHTMDVLAATRADDGMELYRYTSFEKVSADSLPPEATLETQARQLADALMKLRSAPVMDAYAGPAILSGRAAAVFFHENLGHRVEGLNQDDEKEGQTFTNLLNRPVLPKFISVYDDPTLTRLGEVELNGHYVYDDEGVRGQRVPVVEHGVLRSYLLSRTLTKGFTHSNGHGRKLPGFGVVARQGNLVVQSSVTVPEKDLRRMLIEECKKQGRTFGLYFEEVSGGFTHTGGGQPQIYQVNPLMVYKVYVDGRPDELVRGVEIIGTPLASFLNIRACGDRTEVFNGICGAQSGLVPVSAIAPSILTSQIETQKRSWSPNRPPALPPPGGAKDAK